MAEQQSWVTATGRRKTSTAIVRLAAGTGRFTVNDRPMEEYFRRQDLTLVISQPLAVTESAGKYDIAAVVRGGGIVGQAGALRHGIARALSRTSDEVRQALKQAGLLTRDHRMKERKKYGRPGARKRFQFSKR